MVCNKQSPVTCLYVSAANAACADLGHTLGFLVLLFQHVGTYSFSAL